MRLVRSANKRLSLIGGRLIVEPCEVPITTHAIWCFITIYINGTKLNFGATEMKPQAYARQYGTMGRVNLVLSG